MDEATPTGGISRRALLGKVGTYGVPAVIAGGVLLRSGVAFAVTGESAVGPGCPVPSEGSSSSAHSSATGGSGSCATPLDYLTFYRDQLLSIPAPSSKGDARKLSSAIAALTDAIDAGNWQADGTTLTGKRQGSRVFHDLANAVEALDQLKSTPPAVPGIVTGIVTQAGTVASAAATNASLSPKKADEVARLLAKAAAKAARGAYEAAIESYREAWAKASGGSGDGEDEGNDD